MNKADLLVLVGNKILTGGRRTTASNARSVFDELIDSSLNKTDDANAVGGFLSIDGSGKVDVSFIKQDTPTGLYLRDDGTWAAASSGASDLASVLAVGTSTGNLNITSPDGKTQLQVIDDLFLLRYQDGVISSYNYGINSFNMSLFSDGTATAKTFLTAASAKLSYDIAGGNGLVEILETQLTVSHSGQIVFNSPLYNFTNLTADRALYISGSGFLISSVVTGTELSYVSGVTSSLQAQIDALVSGLSWKQAVRVATTANITLSGAQTIDGISVVAGNRVLVKDQSTGSQNGIYICASGAWTRATDMDSAIEFPSATMAISEGSINADKQYVCTNDSPVVVGTTSITFVLVGGTTYVGTTNRITVTGNAIDIAATYLGQSSITTLGTIGTGVWQGTSVSTTYTDAKIKTVTGTAGRITITGTATDPIFNIDVNYSDSITSLGTITAGTWNAAAIADAYIATSYIKADGTRALTADWAAGAFNITAKLFTISGTGGAGFMEYISQSSNASAPSGTGFRIFSGTSGNLNWITKNGSDVYNRKLAATLTADRTYTLQDSSDTFVMRATTDTLTNKRIQSRTGTVASSATPTINTDNIDYFSITALAVAITSFTTNLSGTPAINDVLWIAITDNGTARALTWGASFESSGSLALPTTTVISTRLDIGFTWNEATSKWRICAVQ